jgi:hypothetical protein
MPVHTVKDEMRLEIQRHSYLSLEMGGDECLTGSSTPRDRSSGTKRVGHRTSQDAYTLTLAGIETRSLGFPTNSLVTIATGIQRMDESKNVVYSENTGNNDIFSK